MKYVDGSQNHAMGESAEVEEPETKTKRPRMLPYYVSIWLRLHSYERGIYSRLMPDSVTRKH